MLPRLSAGLRGRAKSCFLAFLYPCTTETRSWPWTLLASSSWSHSSPKQEEEVDVEAIFDPFEVAVVEVSLDREKTEVLVRDEETDATELEETCRVWEAGWDREDG